MKIESSQLELAAVRETRRLDLTVQETQPQIVETPPPGDTVQLSAGAAHPADALDPQQSMDPQTLLIHFIAEILAGRKLPLPVSCQAGSCGAAGVPAAQRQQAGVSVRVLRTEIHVESERTSFRADGEVRTADGRTIAFSAELLMSRDFTAVSQSIGAADPLVVNLDGAPVQVASAKIDFDLNADGQAERISFLTRGSGFLALDRNGDGGINNGAELFGTKTGNGFAELAAYDADRNGWIDEGDPVYSQLLVWTKDAAGRDHLATLAETGVAAIAAASAGTEFSLLDSRNRLDAQVRRSGVYLSEDGAAGTVQQVDLAMG